MCQSRWSTCARRPQAEASEPESAAAGERRDAALPCPEALLAGTLALMTSWADPCPNARLAPARLRPLLARKLVSNLALMSQHPAFSAPLRQVLAQAQGRWAALAGGSAPDRAADAAGAAAVLMGRPGPAPVH